MFSDEHLLGLEKLANPPVKVFIKNYINLNAVIARLKGGGKGILLLPSSLFSLAVSSLFFNPIVFHQIDCLFTDYIRSVFVTDP